MVDGSLGNDEVTWWNVSLLTAASCLYISLSHVTHEHTTKLVSCGVSMESPSDTHQLSHAVQRTDPMTSCGPAEGILLPGHGDGSDRLQTQQKSCWGLSKSSNWWISLSPWKQDVFQNCTTCWWTEAGLISCGVLRPWPLTRLSLCFSFIQLHIHVSHPPTFPPPLSLCR